MQARQLRISPDDGDESATMTKQRLILTPVVGLFAGLSVFSYSAVNMLLNGVHATREATANPCSVLAAANHPAGTTAVRTLPGPRNASGRAQHPASMPLLLADTVRLASTPTPPPVPSTQPSPAASSPTLPQPSPGSSAGPSTLPQPVPAQSPIGSKQLSPGGPNATPSPTSTATSTPTPTPTSPTKPPLGTLCLKIQTLDNVSSVDPHTTVRYAIWVWLSSGTNGTAKITLSASPSSVSPTFTVCVPSGRSDCKVGGLNAGQTVQVQAKLKAPGRSHHQ